MIEQIANTNIFTVDAEYNKPELAAIHIIKQGQALAIVDTGTQFSIPNVESALEQLNANWDDVQYIILTHIHLDHAGGAGQMMALARNARLVVHARGAKHMASPSKLVAGSVAVYGEEVFASLYGDIIPISSERMLIPKESESVSLAGRKLTFIDTPGHADHHFCVWDEQSRSMFTGDTMGVAYQSLRTPNNTYVLPSSTPVQFSPEKLHASINKVMTYQPEQVYVTHYGAVPVAEDWVAGLHEQIDAYTEITAAAAKHSSVAGGSFESRLEKRLLDYLIDRASGVLPDMPNSELEENLKFDAQLNALGLVVWWQRQSLVR